MDNLKNTEEDLENELSLLDVNISSLNVEQKIAFNLVMKTLIEFENNSTDFTPLRLIVAGSAGCGKSYLIKCLVKAVKMFYNFNKSVHVLCPTGNSANLISGVTIHSFFKFQHHANQKILKLQMVLLERHCKTIVRG